MNFNANSYFNSSPIGVMDILALDALYVPATGPTPQNASYWQPYSGLNNTLRKQEGIKTNWGYRQFMTHHAVGIMNFNTTQAQQALGLPIQFKSAISIPEAFNADSDLKKSFVDKERIQSKMVSPSL
jgi:hypothetical protein